MTLAAGTRLGPYEILSALGAGGMGEVYKARDTRLDRTVAIKILPEALAGDPQFRDRFEREAKAIAALTHPHICTLYDVGHQDATEYLVMEYLEGETLESRLKKGALPLDQALKTAIEVASALDKAHRAGIVHRDLKPGNIMLTKTGAKLLDFGLAKATAPVVAGAGLSMLPTTPPNLTAQGTILGTFQYMAPEQLEGQDADARTDIFAYGAVVYETLTGKKAFEGKSQASLIAAIMHHEPPPISMLQPLAPMALDRLVRVCLAKDPDGRWQSVGDLRRELKWIAEGGSQAGASAPVVAGSRRDRIAWVAALGLVTLVAAVLTWRGFRPPAALPERPVVSFEVPTPPTDDPLSFALSPDARLLTYVATSEGRSRLWVRPLDQIAPRSLVGTEGATYPFWSPDGRTIGFFADGKLKRIDIDRGTPQVLADAPNGRGGTWNRDGVILFNAGGLWRVAETGGHAAAVTQLASGAAYWPEFLPDGRQFLFFVSLSRPEVNGLYLGSLDGGKPTRLLATEGRAVFAPPNWLLLPRQNALVAMRFDATSGALSGESTLVAEGVGNNPGLGLGAFSISSRGVLAHRAGSGAQRRQLVWMDRAGMILGKVGPSDENALAEPELAPDGQRLAVRRSVLGNIDVWLIDVARGVPRRFTVDPSTDAREVWSPDGRRLVFASNRNGGSYELFERMASGAGDDRPLHVEGNNALSWSSDGHLLYAKIDPDTGSDLWAVPMIGERKPFPVVQTQFNERAGQFSPDGRWIAYESDESGQFEIYIRPFSKTSDGKWPVSTGGGGQVRWRHDGKELFYVAPDERLMAVPIAAAADGRTLNVGDPVPLFTTHLATGTGIVGIRAQYAVAADGRFLMNTRIDESSAPPITIVLNWDAGLKK